MNRLKHYSLLIALLLTSLLPFHMVKATVGNYKVDKDQAKQVFQNIDKAKKLQDKGFLLINMVLHKNDRNKFNLSKHKELWKAILDETFPKEKNSIRPQGLSLLGPPSSSSSKKSIKLYRNEALGLAVNGFDGTEKEPDKSLSPLFFSSTGFNSLCSFSMAGFAYYIQNKYKVGLDTMLIKGENKQFYFKYENKDYSVTLDNASTYKDYFNRHSDKKNREKVKHHTSEKYYEELFANKKVVDQKKGLDRPHPRDSRVISFSEWEKSDKRARQEVKIFNLTRKNLLGTVFNEAVWPSGSSDDQKSSLTDDEDRIDSYDNIDPLSDQQIGIYFTALAETTAHTSYLMPLFIYTKENEIHPFSLKETERLFKHKKELFKEITKNPLIHQYMHIQQLVAFRVDFATYLGKNYLNDNKKIELVLDNYLDSDYCLLNKGKIKEIVTSIKLENLKNLDNCQLCNEIIDKYLTDTLLWEPSSQYPTSPSSVQNKNSSQRYTQYQDPISPTFEEKKNSFDPPVQGNQNLNSSPLFTPQDERAEDNNNLLFRSLQSSTNKNLSSSPLLTPQNVVIVLFIICLLYIVVQLIKQKKNNVATDQTTRNKRTNSKRERKVISSSTDLHTN